MTLRRMLGSVAALATLAAAAFLYVAHPVRGSDHQDSPTVLKQPGADIADLYVFPGSKDPTRVVLMMNVHPLLTPPATAGASFDPGVLYQFKISHGPAGTTAPEDTVIQILASGTGADQTLTVYGPAKPNRTGTHSTLVDKSGTFAFNDTKAARFDNGIRPFAGPRADPFFFDLFQFFKILPDRNYSSPRTGNKLGTSTPTFNGYAAGSMSGAGGYACSTAPSVNALTQAAPPGFNVLSIVIGLPRSLLMPEGASPIVHVWATASVKSGAGYDQIEQLGRPAVKELFEVYDDHDATNRANPYDDPKLKNSIVDFMKNVAGRSEKISSTIGAVLYPSEIAADLSQTGASAYLGVETGGATGSKFGGRGLTDDIVDISLGAVFGDTVPKLGLAPDDGKENGCLTSEHVTSGQGGTQALADFPYGAPPH
jgi:hypothetical protein